MKNIGHYIKLFEDEWIEITEKELSEIIDNIDSVWNLLFKKYLIKIDNYEKK